MPRSPSPLCLPLGMDVPQVTPAHGHGWGRLYCVGARIICGVCSGGPRCSAPASQPPAPHGARTHARTRTHCGQQAAHTAGRAPSPWPRPPRVPPPCPAGRAWRPLPAAPCTERALAPVSQPRSPRGAPVTVGLSTEIHWVKNKVLFILPPGLPLPRGCCRVCLGVSGATLETGGGLAACEHRPG